jgi:AraC-like DNA-binding protein
MPLKRWNEYLQTNLFKKQDGFFELPYLSNSPQLMTESIIRMPVSSHNQQEQAIYTDNPFSKGSMRYRELDKGLWLLGSELQVKQNIISRALYDEEEPGNYYFISFSVFDYRFPINGSGSEPATLLSTTCTFYKPGTEVTTYFYEGTKGRFFNLVFNKEWAKKNLLFKTSLEKKELDEYLNAESGFINWLDIVQDAPKLSEVFWNSLAPQQSAANLNNLKNTVTVVILDFFKHAFKDKRIKNHTALHNPDYANVAAAEKMILHNLDAPFIGVENIARAVNVSPTKLKMIFKSVFGFSMLQYHKEKNMLLAFQLIKRSDIQVKYVAELAGSASSSKFAAAFKKRFGLSPTDLRKDQSVLLKTS